MSDQWRKETCEDCGFQLIGTCREGSAKISLGSDCAFWPRVEYTVNDSSFDGGSQEMWQLACSCWYHFEEVEDAGPEQTESEGNKASG